MTNALGPRLRPQYLSTHYWIAKHHHRWYLWLKTKETVGMKTSRSGLTCMGITAWKFFQSYHGATKILVSRAVNLASFLSIKFTFERHACLMCSENPCLCSIHWRTCSRLFNPLRILFWPCWWKPGLSNTQEIPLENLTFQEYFW